MNFWKRFLPGAALAGLALLSACASDDTPAGQPFTYNGNRWIVSDVRGEDRLVITVVDPKLPGLGTEAAARHAVTAMPEAEYRAAATGWLTVTGRFCTPGPSEDTGEDGVYQYHYSCWEPA